MSCDSAGWLSLVGWPFCSMGCRLRWKSSEAWLGWHHKKGSAVQPAVTADFSWAPGWECVFHLRYLVFQSSMKQETEAASYLKAWVWNPRMSLLPHSVGQSYKVSQDSRAGEICFPFACEEWQLWSGWRWIGGSCLWRLVNKGSRQKWN